MNLLLTNLKMKIYKLFIFNYLMVNFLELGDYFCCFYIRTVLNVEVVEKGLFVYA